MSGKITSGFVNTGSDVGLAGALTIVRLGVQFAIALINCQPCIGKSNPLSGVRTFKQAGSPWLGALERRAYTEVRKMPPPTQPFHIGLTSDTLDVTDLGLSF